MLAQESHPGANFERRIDLTPSQCRLLRGRLGWSPEQLASAAGVATLTVLTFELGRRKPREETLIALRRAFRSGLHGAARERGFGHPGDDRFPEVRRPAALENG